MARNILKLLILVLLVLYGLKSNSYAQDEENPFFYNRDLSQNQIYDSKNYMTGNWGGLRGKLDEIGITPRATYYMTILGNPVGGETKGVQYAGLLDAYLEFNLQKLFGIKKTKFIISGSWASGRSLSEENIGNFFTVSEAFSGRSIRLYQLFIEAEIVENTLTLAIGRMGVADEFSTSKIFYHYVSTAINGHPISFAINDEGYFSDPQASWASRMTFNPIKAFYMKAGVYNSNPEVGRDSAHGVDFSFRKGVIVIGEVGYLLNHDEDSKGLFGRYTFGAFYDTKKVDKLQENSGRKKGNYGLYWILEQTIYRETDYDKQGLTPWMALTISPDETINSFPFFVSGGLVYKGLIPNRNVDKTAFGFAYGSLSEDIENRDYEFMAELTYIIQATRWFQIQPDIQWIVHPGGNSDIPNAVVVGVQLAVDL